MSHYHKYSDPPYRYTTMYDYKSKFVITHGTTYGYDNVIYVNYNSKVTIVCQLHGDFLQSPNNHIHGAGCPRCANIAKNKKLTHNKQSFVAKAEIIHGNTYQYDNVAYTNTTTKISITCLVHGDFLQQPKEHLRGYGCVLCGREKTKNAHQRDTDWFIRQSTNIHGSFYDYSAVVYHKSVIPVKIICPTHGAFFQQPNHHINARCGCPKCIMSTGERKILSWLQDNNIDCEYEYQERIDNKLLRFDFIIHTKRLIIEYDGEHHFRPVQFNGISMDQAITSHEKTIQHDALKNEFAMNNNLQLLRIPYYQFNNISDILTEVLLRQ